MNENRPSTKRPVSLKKLAQHLGLNPATVSVVLNDVPGRSIPQATRDRIKAVAKELNYQPNHLARSLRNHRSLNIGILVPELGDGYHTQVVSSIGNYLMDAGYFYFTAHHRHRKHLVEEYGRLLLSRGAEALIAIDTLLDHPFPVPVVAVAGHRSINGVTNVVLDHRLAAKLALTHLHSLGHRRIAFLRGQSFSLDSSERWSYLVHVAQEMDFPIKEELIVQLERDVYSPELGYSIIRRLLSHRGQFTALVAFNDISAMGAMRAFQDFGIRVPVDISVIGFDDISGAAFTNPRLTTIRQHLSDLGQLAARCIVNRLHGTEPFRQQIMMEPELVIRESTAQATDMMEPLAIGGKQTDISVA